MDALSPLLQAAERKVRIAAFHRSQLEKYLRGEPRSKDVPIPIQAHFEGVVVSVMAAVDQVAQAVNSALCLRATPGELVEKTFSMIGDVPGVGEWYQEQIGRDLRSIRTKIVH